MNEEDIARWNLISDLRSITKTLESDDYKSYINSIIGDVKDALHRVDKLASLIQFKGQVLSDKKIVEFKIESNP